MEFPTKRRKLSLVFLLWFVCVLNHVRNVAGHGMLLDPPNRSSIWRFKANNPAFENATENWSDNELYCGRQAFVQTGKCGVCGDNFTDPVPRKNEDGGIYGQGIITGTYKSGEVVELKVHLNTSHFGYFEMRLCAEDDVNSHLNESCYEKHLLEIISPGNTDSWLQNTNGWLKATEQEKEISVEKINVLSNNMCADASTTTSKPKRRTTTAASTTTSKPKRRTTTAASTTTSKPKRKTTTAASTTTSKPKRKTTTAASTTPRVTSTILTSKSTSTTPRSTQGTTTRKVGVTATQKPNGRITKYYIKTATIHPQDAPVEHLFKVKLPKGIKCKNCVLQWQYTTGNDWGLCEDGTWAKGCGPQETFRNCADISIL